MDHTNRIFKSIAESYRQKRRPFTPSNLGLEQVDALVKALETLPKFDADAASMLLTCWKFA